MVPRKEKGSQNSDLSIDFQFKTRKINEICSKKKGQMMIGAEIKLKKKRKTVEAINKNKGSCLVRKTMKWSIISQGQHSTREWGRTERELTQEAPLPVP